MISTYVIIALIIYWIIYAGWISYCCGMWRRNTKVVKNEVIEVLQAKIDEFFNKLDLWNEGKCARTSLENIEIKGVKYSYRIIIVLDPNNTKEVYTIEIKLQRE